MESRFPISFAELGFASFLDTLETNGGYSANTKYVIPACAGITKRNYFRPFSPASRLISMAARLAWRFMVDRSAFSAGL